MGERELLACQTLGNNHSADRVTLFYGETEPLILCGYHASQTANLNLTELKAKLN